jgi:hypothetical protein
MQRLEVVLKAHNAGQVTLTLFCLRDPQSNWLL